MRQKQHRRRAPLSRDRVLRAALRLADDRGIEALTMRKLGQTLGVEAMSLYNHVASKDDILGEMVELVFAEIELPPAEQDWEAAIRTCAISAHEALRRHPWACNLIMSPPRIGTGRLRYMNWVLGRFREAGFSAELTYHAYHAVDSHILGFTLWELGHSIDAEEMRAFAETFLRELPADEYPHLIEHGEQHLAETVEGDEFEFGLGLILDGLKRMRDNSAD